MHLIDVTVIVEVARFVYPSDNRVTRRLALLWNLVTEGIDYTSTNEEVHDYASFAQISDQCSTTIGQ